MAREPAADEARRRAQRERIVADALAVFMEHGQEARVDDVVARARISKRTLYEHFRDLDALRGAVLEVAIERAVTSLARISMDATVVDPLRETLVALFASAQENRPLGLMLYHQLWQGDPLRVAARQRIIDFFVHAFLEGWGADHAAGRTPRPPDEVIVRTIVGGAQGLALWILEKDPPLRPQDVADGVLALMRAYSPFVPAAAPSTA